MLLNIFKLLFSNSLTLQEKIYSIHWVNSKDKSVYINNEIDKCNAIIIEQKKNIKYLKHLMSLEEK